MSRRSGKTVRAPAGARRAGSSKDLARAKRTTAVICLVLAGACVALYARTLRYGFVTYDDPLYVSYNAALRSGLTWQGIVWAFTTWHGFFYHPVTWLSYLLDATVFGFEPAGYHLTSLLLHVANTLVLFFILERMTGNVWPSAAAGMLFAIHPFFVESVAWISERRDLLSALFWLLAILAYVSYARRPSAWRSAAVAGLFLLGLMSKPTIATFPFVLLLLDFWPLDRFRGVRDWRGAVRRLGRLLLEKTPLFLLSIASAVLASIAARRVIGGRSGVLLVMGDHLSPGARIGDSAVAYTVYALKTFWPWCLAAFYPHPPTARPWWQVTGASLLLIAVTVLALRTWRRRPYFCVGWLWYLGVLFPFVGLVQQRESAYADRYTYIPLMGLFIAVAWGVADLAARFRPPRIVLAAATGGAMLALAIRTSVQVGYWKDTETLFGHAIRVTEGNWKAHCILAGHLANAGRLEEAIPHYLKAIEANPRYTDPLLGLGWELARRGRLKEATPYFREAVRIEPDFSLTHLNLAMVLIRSGEYAEAEEHLCRAKALDPDRAAIYHNFGVLRSLGGKSLEAIEQFGQALKRNEASADTHYELGRELHKIGRSAEALTHYRRAVELNPGLSAARSDLAALSADMGGSDEAVAHYREVLRADPRSVAAHVGLGTLFGKQGKMDQAIVHYREAVRIKPDYVAAHYNLGLALALEGKHDQAAAEYEEALRLDPTHAKAHNELAKSLALQGRMSESIAHLRRASELKPDWPEPQNMLAWLLATSRDPGVRNGAEAVRLAIRVCELTRYERAEALNTLAAAYAEAGRFAEAQGWAGKAIDLATRSGRQTLADEVRAHLKLYESSTALRLPPQ